MVTADSSGVKRFFCPRASTGERMLRNKKLIQNFKGNQLDTTHCSSFLQFHGFCQAQTCQLARVILVIASALFVSGGPDFNGVTEEHGCWRRRLLPAVCGAADVIGRDDGDVLTRFTVPGESQCLPFFVTPSLNRSTSEHFISSFYTN